MAFKSQMNTLKIFGLIIAVTLSSCDYKPRNQGRALYAEHCLSCHMDNGEGLGELFPPIRNSDYIIKNKSDLACLIRHGISGTLAVNGKTYNGQMAGNKQLTDVEVANLVHYILVDMNNEESSYSALEVKQHLEGCPNE